MNLNQLIFKLLLLVIVVLPLSIPVSGYLLTGTVILALFDYFFLNKGKNKRKESWPKKIKITTLVLLAISAISLLFSRDMFASTYNYVYVVGQYVGIIFLITHYAYQRERLLLILKVFLGVGLVVAMYGIYQYVEGLAVIKGDWVDLQEFPELKQRVFATLGNPNILGSFLVMIASYCLAFFSVLPGGKRRIYLSVLFLVSVGCLALTFSRGNWLSLAAVMILYVMAFYHKAAIPLLAALMVLVITGWNMFYTRFISIFYAQDTSVALRFAYVESSLAMISDFPWGVGWYGYMFVFPEYDFYLNNPSVPMYHCHNLLLNITAELGIQGVIAFLLLLSLLMHGAWRLERQTVDYFEKGFARGYLLSIFGICISGLTDHTLFNIQLGILFWIFNTILMELLSKIEK